MTEIIDSDLVENSLSKLGRSKSEDDITSICIDFADNRNPLIRQGAFRRRITEQADKKSNNRHSSEHDNCCQMIDCVSSASNHRPSIDVNMFNQRCGKSGKVTLTVVKDVWRSLRREWRDGATPSTATLRNSINGNTIDEEENGTKNKPPKISEIADRKGSFEATVKRIRSFLDEVSETGYSAKVRRIDIEGSLVELIGTTEALTKSELEQQTAIWELIETEVGHLKHLGLIVEVFLPAFEKIKSECSHLQNIDTRNVFGNIREIYECHWQLWSRCICLPLTQSRIHGSLLDISLMKNGFCQISIIMDEYRLFMQKQQRNIARIKQLKEDSRVFSEFLEWSKGYSKLCRDGIGSALIVPFQRITKYKLILERIRQLSIEEKKEDINEMISTIHNFVHEINHLVGTQRNMEDISSKLVKSKFCRSYVDISKYAIDEILSFDVLSAPAGHPERVLVHSGHLKLKESANKTSEVQCFLFTDMFLVCKPVHKNWQKLKPFKSPIRLDKMRIEEESEDQFLVMIFSDFGNVDDIMLLVGEKDDVKLWEEHCKRHQSIFMDYFRRYHRQLSFNLGSVADSYELSSVFAYKASNDDQLIPDEISDGYFMKKRPSVCSSSSNSSFSKGHAKATELAQTAVPKNDATFRKISSATHQTSESCNDLTTISEEMMHKVNEQEQFEENALKTECFV